MQKKLYNSVNGSKSTGGSLCFICTVRLATGSLKSAQCTILDELVGEASTTKSDVGATRAETHSTGSY